MIFLLTDFGASDLYVGQVKAVLQRTAPGVPVIDLLHEAPPFNVKAAAHLLAALATRIPEGAVTMAVVDPGVGGSRRAIALVADDRWFVGPDNGLLSVVAARSRKAKAFPIGWRPRGLSASFHGRDLFAPVAVRLALGDRRSASLGRRTRPDHDLGAGDLPEIIYIDHYGNAMTGLRAAGVRPSRRLTVNGHAVSRARVFSEVGAGQPFWYENSLGLVEIAANSASAREVLRLGLGDVVS